MSLTKDFVVNAVSNRLIFTDHDYMNFMNFCKAKIDIAEFKKLKNDLKQFNYKISSSFFGKEYIHPIEKNPYTKNYDLSDIMFELKLHNEKIKSEDKLNKLINYFKYAK